MAKYIVSTQLINIEMKITIPPSLWCHTRDSPSQNIESLCSNLYSLDISNIDVTKRTSLEGWETFIRIISIYDGDTFDCLYEIDGKYTPIRVRMYGYDTPEIKPKRPSDFKNLSNKEQQEIEEWISIEKKEAIKSKLFLTKLLFENSNGVIRVRFGENDMYGRALSIIWIPRFKTSNLSSLNKSEDWLCVNDLMVYYDYAYPYFGKTKMSFKDFYTNKQNKPKSKKHNSNELLLGFTKDEIEAIESSSSYYIHTDKTKSKQTLIILQ